MIRFNRRRVLYVTAGCTLILAALLLVGPWNQDKDRRHRSAAQQLLGPFAHIAQDVTWFAAQRALLAGENARAIVLAERATGLAPGESLGWERYGSMVGTLMASPSSEGDPALRLAWVRSALQIFERGEALCRNPARIASTRGIYLLSRTQVDPDLPWPGGPAEPWSLAAEAFEACANFSTNPAERERALTLAAEARSAAGQVR